MVCPLCNKEMKMQRNDITSNLRMGKDYKEYRRVVYWCLEDDVWVSVETPVVPPENLA